MVGRRVKGKKRKHQKDAQRRVEWGCNKRNRPGGIQGNMGGRKQENSVVQKMGLESRNETRRQRDDDMERLQKPSARDTFTLSSWNSSANNRVIPSSHRRHLLDDVVVIVKIIIVVFVVVIVILEPRIDAPLF